MSLLSRRLSSLLGQRHFREVADGLLSAKQAMLSRSKGEDGPLAVFAEIGCTRDPGHLAPFHERITSHFGDVIHWPARVTSRGSKLHLISPVPGADLCRKHVGRLWDGCCHRRATAPRRASPSHFLTPPAPSRRSPRRLAERPRCRRKRIDPGGQCALHRYPVRSGAPP